MAAVLFLKWVILSPVLVHNSPFSGLANTGRLAFTGAKFVYDIVDMFIKDDDGETLERIGEMEKEISQKLDASVTTILKRNSLLMKLERVEDAIVAVHSSLMDLNLVIKNAKEPTRERYEELFMLYYLNNEVTKHIRFLPTLLNYEIPGTRGKLLEVWVDHNRCNMTALFVFKQFYFDLLSSGMTIEATFNYLRFGISSDDSLKEWEPRVDEMTNVFEDYENLCKDKFIELATEDVGNIKGAEELSTALEQRYPWKIHDTFCLKTPGTFQFIYYESKGDHIIYKESEDCRRLVVSIDKGVLNQYATIERIDGELFRPSITSPSDGHAALHVGTSIRTKLIDQGYDVKAIFSYFDDVTKTDDIFLDEASPFLTIVVPNVTLSYCHQSGLECVFHGDNEVVGDMRVYIYVKRILTDYVGDLKNGTKGRIPDKDGEGIPVKPGERILDQTDTITKGFAPARLTASPYVSVLFSLVVQTCILLLL